MLFISKNKPRLMKDKSNLYSNLQSTLFDVAQGRMNGTPNETRTHSCRFANRYTTRGVQSNLYKTLKGFKLRSAL